MKRWRTISLNVMGTVMLMASPAAMAKAVCADLVRAADLRPEERYPAGSLARHAWDLGVSAIAVSIPIRRLPEFLAGQDLNQIPNGIDGGPRGLVVMYPLFQPGRAGDDPQRLLSQRVWRKNAGGPPGDFENIVLIFSLTKLDTLIWKRWPKHVVATFSDKNVIELSSFSVRLPEIKHWGHDLSSFTLITRDLLNLNDVDGIWVHPKKRKHFESLWTEGVARSKDWEFDYADLRERVLIQHAPP